MTDSDTISDTEIYDYYRDLAESYSGVDDVSEILQPLYGAPFEEYCRVAYNLATTDKPDASECEWHISAQAMIDATNQFHTNPIQVQEGVVQCGRCGSERTIYVEKQTRSADEAATLFCRCLNCKNSWKEN